MPSSENEMHQEVDEPLEVHSHIQVQPYFDKSKVYGTCPICTTTLIFPKGDSTVECDTCKQLLEVDH